MDSDGTSIELYSSDENNTNISKNSTDINETDNYKVNDRPIDIRENYVTKAIEFLNAETIRNTPSDRKVQFLKSKGLTAQEINVAFSRISDINFPNQQFNSSNQFQPYYNSTHSYGVLQKPYETQGWFRKLFGPIALASTFIYICFHIYKKYIEVWLFGTQKPTVEERLQMVELSIQKCLLLLEKKNLESEDHISKHQTHNQIENDFIKQELKSLKSLLLSRNQFPPANGTPSLPQWQQTKQLKCINDTQIKNNSISLTQSINGNISKDKSNTDNSQLSSIKHTKQNQNSSNTNVSNSISSESVDIDETDCVFKLENKENQI
ncbi:peroxisomal membrane protein PEX14 [Daktulosphaira vitifoliae]|uniref:peroxisomal membrane protein PEX14 n=1 Tax=Daktulosphaira vitifoliae TaxID=58002 RepID=UPI0021AA9CEE|nr:peroxisomal membrane protein PEX14 [Daktulosphaira vitifoliae]XP_050539552.1 peroxisomal membrane protein PEX14 [Daktulosphaira vitifoliae]XP_050539553.1 peroxisomal membrane protein PEX14 [Daktulosphaira vitifoliae]